MLLNSRSPWGNYPAGLLGLTFSISHIAPGFVSLDKKPHTLPLGQSRSQTRHHTTGRTSIKRVQQTSRNGHSIGLPSCRLLQIEQGPGRGLSQAPSGPGWAEKRPTTNEFRSYPPPTTQKKHSFECIGASQWVRRACRARCSHDRCLRKKCPS